YQRPSASSSRQMTTGPRSIRVTVREHRLTLFLKLAYNPPLPAGRREFVRRYFSRDCHFRDAADRVAGCKAMTDLKGSKSIVLWIAAGTGAAVLGGAILFQCVRAQPGSAAEATSGRAGASDAATGKTRVPTPAKSSSQPAAI